MLVLYLKMKNKIDLLKTVVLVFFVFWAFSQKAFAYGFDTHALLTKESIDLYNRESGGKISDPLKSFIIDGSRQEDNAPRWLNHFYDPVYERSLAFDPAIDPELVWLKNIMGASATSKEWAQSELRQSSIPYSLASLIDIKPLHIGSILAGTEQKKLGSLNTEADFAWQRALRLYINGEEEKAMFTLGHVLHLMEDMSVPDHTRNDAHAGDSPYESYASRYDLGNPDNELETRLSGKPSVKIDNLDGYFTSLAEYSNKNFYSKNTMGIQSGYPEPVPSFVKREGEQSYGIIQDEIGEYKLMTVPTKFDYVFSSLVLSTIDDESVLPGYWSRLSTKSVEYTAGVIDLFFKEAEKYKDDPRGIPGDRSFLAEIGEAVGDLFINAGSAIKGAVLNMMDEGNKKTVDEIPLGDKSSGDSEENPTENKDKDKKKVIPLVSASKKEVKQGQVIHEKGSKFTPDSEVILYFDLPDGRIISSQITAGSDGKFDKRYVMPEDALLGRYLYYAEDEVAGVVSEKIFFDVIEGNKKATPKPPVMIQNDDEDNGDVEEDDKEDEKEDKITAVKITAPTPVCSYGLTGTSSDRSVIINEIAWMGGTSNSSDEWVELKNISSSPVDISGWEMIGEEEDIALKFSPQTIIPAGGFILLERTDDDSVLSIVADRIYSGALSNNSDGLKLFDDHCLAVDQVYASPSWAAGDASSRRTMERTASGWQTSSLPGGTPKMENSPGYITPIQALPSTVNNLTSGGGSSSPAICSDKSGTPSYEIKINEVAWSGDASSSSHEWVELFNPSTSEVSISGWQLLDAANDIKLIFNSGTSISAGGYLIAERGSVDFITDTSADAFFSGAINNSGESLYLFDKNCILADKLENSGDNWKNFGGSASPTFLTAERDSSGWHTYSGAGSGGVMGSPRATNSERPKDDEDDIFGSEGIGVLISEIMPGKADEGDDEFIELYNPTSSLVDLSGWSISRQVGVDKREEFIISSEGDLLSGISIEPKGFILIGSGKYSSVEKPADAIYPSGAPHLIFGGDTITLYDDAGTLIDSLEYGSIESGKSWERRAFLGGKCVSASGESEFSGNGCGVLEGGLLEKRDDPMPQNKFSLKEPRERPVIPFGESDLIASYDSEKVSIVFTHPELGSGLAGVISEKETESEFSSGESYRIYEVSRSYEFSFRVTDEDGFSSEAMDKSVDVPGFADIGFYRGNKVDFDGLTHSGPIVDIKFNEYPFLPRDLVLYSSVPPGPNYKVLVFYLNKDVPKEEFLNEEVPEAGEVSILSPSYKAYISGYAERRSLMIPDGDNYYIGGIDHDKSLDKNLYLSEGDKNIVLPVRGSGGEVDFYSGDCLSVGYYGLYRGYESSTPETDQFKLIAVDNKRYCFSGEYASASPSTPSNISFLYKGERLYVYWDNSQDSDSPDSLISYEISYDNGETWGPASQGDKTTPPPGEVTVMVRAIDDFGVKSGISSGSYTVPEPPPDEPGI